MAFELGTYGPRFPGIGDEVEVEWLSLADGGVGRVAGRLGAVVDGDDITDVVVESDGGATFIPVGLVVRIEAA